MRALTRESLAVVLLVLLGALTFVNALPNSFHFDDYTTIVLNGAIRTLEFVPSYFTDTSMWTISRLRDWRPIVLLTFALDYWLAGLNPIVFRATNLFFHIGIGYLIFLIFRDIAARQAARLQWSESAIRRIGLTAAILFVVHTANSEVVNYIFARSTLLATLFYTLGFYAYLRGPFRENKPGSRIWTAVGLAAYVLGVGSKGSAVALPVALLAFEMIFLNPSGLPAHRLFYAERRRLNKYWPLALICIGYIIVRQSLAPRALEGLLGGRRISPYVYLLTQFRAWTFYLGIFFWPGRLISDYTGFGWSGSLWDSSVLWSLALVAPILGAAVGLKKTAPVYSFFIFWYFIALLPEASIVPLSDAVNGYRFYGSNIGLSIIVTLLLFDTFRWLLNPHNRHHRAQAAANLFPGSLLASCLVGILIVSTWQRNEVFRDKETFWSDILKKDPIGFRAHLGLGSYYLDEQRYAEALPLFEKAIQLRPRNAFGYMFRGYLSSLLNRHDDAIRDYDLAIRYDRRDSFVYFLRGDSYKAIGDDAAALADYDHALSLRPTYTDVYLAQAEILERLGKSTDAFTACRTGMKIDPDEAEFYLCLGRLLEKSQRFREALSLYEQATQRGIGTPEIWQALAKVYERENKNAQAAAAYAEAVRHLGRVPEGKKPKFYPAQDRDED